MKSSIISVLACAAVVLAGPIEQRAVTTSTTTTATATKVTTTTSTTTTTPTSTPTNYGSYGNYGNYGSYGKYSRTAEAEAEIEALLNLASTIKAKREAEFASEA